MENGGKEMTRNNHFAYIFFPVGKVIHAPCKKQNKKKQQQQKPTNLPITIYI